MSALINIKDSPFGNSYIVIPKIREVSKGLGSVVITLDNGDKKNIECKHPDELLKQITDEINNYYTPPK
jgi:hypothetical protein